MPFYYCIFSNLFILLKEFPRACSQYRLTLVSSSIFQVHDWSLLKKHLKKYSFLTPLPQVSQSTDDGEDLVVCGGDGGVCCWCGRGTACQQVLQGRGSRPPLTSLPEKCGELWPGSVSGCKPGEYIQGATSLSLLYLCVSYKHIFWLNGPGLFSSTVVW